MIAPNCSRRLLQPNQPPLRLYYWVLLAAVVSRNEGNRWVRNICIKLQSSPPTKGRADLNIYGKIQRTSSDQRRCRRLNTSSTSWLGCKATSTTRICSQVELVSYVPQNSSIAAVLKRCCRCSFSQVLPNFTSPAIETPISRLCPHILPPLSRRCPARPWAPSEH